MLFFTLSSSCASSSSAPSRLGPPKSSSRSRPSDQLCGSAWRRAGETGAGPACSGHTVSSWQGRSWELFSGRRMGGSASHRRARTRANTHTRRHARTYAYRAATQPGRLVCLPPIRPLCFLSPRCEAVRGATALSHFHIRTAAVTKTGTHV